MTKIECELDTTCRNNMPELPVKIEDNKLKMPPWMGNEKFHISHMSNLLRKNYKFYKKYKWNVSKDIPYVWPK